MLGTWGLYQVGDLRGHRGLYGRLFQERDHLRETLRTGRAGERLIPAGVMGWAHPWFEKDQGVAGGVDIALFEGHKTAAAASAAGYERLMLLHRMNACRQPEAMWNGEGDPVGVHLWRDADGLVLFDFRTNARMVAADFKYPCNGGPPPGEQVRAVHELGLRPDYDLGSWHEPGGEIPFRNDNMHAWMPHDGQHWIRYTKNTKALVWLGDDPLARDDLILSAELFHLMFHEFAHHKETWSDGVSLRQHELHAEQHPNQGDYIGRDSAWGIDSMCAGYSVASPEWRELNRPWFNRVARLFQRIAMPNGLLQRKGHPTLIGHDRYDAAQTYQCLFLLHAMRTMNESVFRGVDEGRRRRLDELLVRSLDYLYWKPVWGRVRSGWQPPGAEAPVFDYGPRWSFAVGLKDGWKEPPFCDEARWGPDYLPEEGLWGGVEDYHCWWALEYGMLATDGSRGSGLENRYLRRVLDCWIRPGGYDDLVRRLFADTGDLSSDNSGNWIGLVGRLQALGITTERELRRQQLGGGDFFVDPEAVAGPEPRYFEREEAVDDEEEEGDGRDGRRYRKDRGSRRDR
jgi:hypothetical protein